MDQEHVSPEATGYRLRGQLYPMPDHATYMAAGVIDETPIPVASFARAIAFQHRDDVLAVPAERRIGLAEGLAPLLVLDDWQHPDLAASERPSATPSFRQLAEILATGETGRYRPGPGNTHWRNWPDGGSL